MNVISNKNNFIYLLYALILLLFSSAFTHQLKDLLPNNFNELVLVIVFLLGVHSLKSEKSWIWSVYFMAFVTAVLFILKKTVNDSILFEYIHLLIFLSFFVGSFALSAKQILISEHVNKNMIVGSVVLYLLLGLIWTTIYLLIIMIFPDSFNGLEALPWQENFSKVSYYSFVTITTLGYGDISPKNSIAEFFVLSEAVVGVFYMAIIVSSLISARLNSLKK